MDEKRLDLLMGMLFEKQDEVLKPPRLTYAVLDAARDPRVFELVHESPRPFVCLYKGDLAPGMAEVAPYLVQLHKDDPFARQLVDEAWGNSWGIFLDASMPFATVERHLRSFLKVQDEDGRKLLFRYYDPRVIRLYLPITDASETRQFGGALRRFLVESEDGEMVLTWQVTAERFDLKRQSLKQTEWAAPETTAQAARKKYRMVKIGE